MSVADEPSGDLSGSLDQQVPEDNVDQGNAVTPTEAQENASLSKPVYLASRLPQDIVPGVDIPPSRKHEVPSSELELETPAIPFTIGSGPRLVSPENKALLPHTNPEEEKGIRESRNTHQRSSMRVISSGDSLTKQPLSRKRSMSEGSTPHSSTQQASDDGYVSPIVVQQLKERLRQLEERVANDADEKKKFEGLYISEKQKCEEIELKSSKYKQEVAKLRKVVYKLDKFGIYAVLTTDEESLVQSVRAEQVVTNEVHKADEGSLVGSVHTEQVVRSEVQSDQEVPDMDENGLLLGIDMLMSSQLDQQQPPFSGVDTLHVHLRSLVQTGKGKQKICNVCFEKKPIDSHYITRGVLEGTCGKCQSILVVDQRRHSLTITSPDGFKEKLECAECDRSTSHLEGKFIERLLFTGHYKPGIGLHEDDALVFLFYAYRMLSMRNVLQYAVEDEVASYEDLESFMEQVWKIRRGLLPQQESYARDKVLFHVFTESETADAEYRITLTLCKMDLTDLNHSLGCCPLIYAQALHCSWAVLLGEHRATELQHHFERMIHRIHHHLSKEKVEIRGFVRKNSLQFKV